MTSRIRRTQINIETHEVKIIRFSGGRFSVRCERCQTIVRAFTLEQITEIFGMNLTDVCRLIGEDEFHLTNAKRGLPTVCENSFGNQELRLKALANQVQKME